MSAADSGNYDVAVEAARLLRVSSQYPVGALGAEIEAEAAANDRAALALLESLEAVTPVDGLLERAVEGVEANGNFASRIAAVQGRLVNIGGGAVPESTFLRADTSVSGPCVLSVPPSAIVTTGSRVIVTAIFNVPGTATNVSVVDSQGNAYALIGASTGDGKGHAFEATLTTPLVGDNFDTITVSNEAVDNVRAVAIYLAA